MAEKPNNIGQVLFESLGKGLEYTGANLVPFLQMERDNRMKQLQFQMEQEQHKAQMEQLNVANQMADIKRKDALQMAADPKGYAIRKAQEAAQAEQAFQQTFIGGVLGQTPMGGILNAVGQPAPQLPLAQLIPMAQAQGLPFKFDTGSASLDLTQQPSPIDFNAVLGQAGAVGLEPSGMGITASGERTFQFARPPVDPSTKPLTPAELRAQRKEQERLDKDAIIEQAASVYRSLPTDIKQQIGIGDITKYDDLAKILIDERIAGKKNKRFGIDWLASDMTGVPEVLDHLSRLAAQYQAIGGAANLLKSNSMQATPEEIAAEKKRRGLK